MGSNGGRSEVFLKKMSMVKISMMRFGRKMSLGENGAFGVWSSGLGG